MFAKALLIAFIIVEFSYRAHCATIWEWLAIDGVQEDTGYTWDVLDFIFLRYYDDIISPKRCGFRQPCREHNATWNHIHFYLLFV